MEGQVRKSKVGISQNPCLPQHLLIYEILIRLPVKSLVRFKSVCKDWRSIISSPRFAKFHLNRSKSLPSDSGLERSLFVRQGGSCDMLKRQSVHGDDGEEVWESVKFKRCHYLQKLGSDTSFRVVGSCNGLVCLYFKLSNCFCLWNPCIDDFCQVAFPNVFCLNAGFGYVAGKDDYKIFATGFPCENRERSALVYSLRDDKWTKITGLVDGLAGSCMDGVLVDETLYWAPNKIIGFNLGDDTFHEVPRTQLGNNFLCMGLCALDGSLCAWDYERDFSTEVNFLELGMFKYQSSSRSWTKIFKFDLSILGLYVQAFCGFTTSGKVLVQRNRELEVELFLGCPNQNPPNFVSVVQGAGHVVSFNESLIWPSQFQNGEEVQQRTVEG